MLKMFLCCLKTNANLTCEKHHDCETEIRPLFIKHLNKKENKFH